MDYELVCGLETHLELATATKLFCGCPAAFGAPPNTLCCPVCTGMPGTLPSLNEKAVEYTILAGLSLGCEITPVSHFDRKNYVYPDLPKAFQITQLDRPFCKNGFLQLESGKRIRITRIHLEEDAGKLMHEDGLTRIDYNRAGIPLIEIVTKPDFASHSEIREYVEKLATLMRYIGISSCKMQEGALRCDLNISVRPVGSTALGTRTEIKNLNSITHMEKAAQSEFTRQCQLLEAGGIVTQETRRFDEASSTTQPMRTKEAARDYRYFREPDLPSVVVSPESIDKLRVQLPELPLQKQNRYVTSLGLPPADARLLVNHKAIAAFFDTAICGLQNPRAAANFMLGQIFRRLPSDTDKQTCAISFAPEALHELLCLVENGQLSMGQAKITLEAMLDSGQPPHALLDTQSLIALDTDLLHTAVTRAITENPTAAADYLAGKQKALHVLVGSVMKQTHGKADSQTTAKLLQIELSAN